MSVNGNISSMQKPNSRFATSIIPQQSFEQKNMRNHVCKFKFTQVILKSISWSLQLFK